MIKCKLLLTSYSEGAFPFFRGLIPPGAASMAAILSPGEDGGGAFLWSKISFPRQPQERGKI